MLNIDVELFKQIFTKFSTFFQCSTYLAQNAWAGKKYIKNDYLFFFSEDMQVFYDFNYIDGHYESQIISSKRLDKRVAPGVTCVRFVLIAEIKSYYLQSSYACKWNPRRARVAKGGLLSYLFVCLRMITIRKYSAVIFRMMMRAIFFCRQKKVMTRWFVEVKYHRRTYILNVLSLR